MKAKFIVLGLENHPDLDGIGERYGLADFENPSFRQAVIYPQIDRFRPVLVTNGSILRRLSDLSRYDGVDFKLHAIFYRGERISMPHRKKFAHQFGCEIYTTYGSRECSLIGIECAHHGLHTAPWMNFVEITDENGNPMPLGEEGNVTVTFFENFAMPFIRYQLGDQGALHAASCACGRKTKLLSIRGRDVMVIEIPGSIEMPLVNLTRFLDERYSDYILQYQFEYNPSLPPNLIFRYIPFGICSPSNEQAIQQYFEKQLLGKVRVSIQAVKAIRPTAQGKSSIFIRSTD